jgi:hypothetical protein
VGSTPAAHLAFWLVSTVGHYVPHLALSAHASNPPAPLVLAGDILVEILSHRMLSPNVLAQATAVGIYAVFMDMPPKWRPGGPWPGTGLKENVGLWLPPFMVDRLFMLIHNILPLRGHLASMGAAADRSCAHCGDCEDVAHIFQHALR